MKGPISQITKCQINTTQSLWTSLIMWIVTSQLKIIYLQLLMKINYCLKLNHPAISPVHSALVLGMFVESIKIKSEMKLMPFYTKIALILQVFKKLIWGTGACSTENYTWYLINHAKTKKRGEGMLIRKNLKIQIRRLKNHFGAIITLLGKFYQRLEKFFLLPRIYHLKHHNTIV